MMMMNRFPGLVRTAIVGGKSTIRTFRSNYGPSCMPMKAGTELTSLNIFKDQDAPKVLERSEYPEWVNRLSSPLPSLAVLRRIPNEEAEDKQILRYLKLNRRLEIRQRNEEKAS
jgi:hypothetical protein